jgi:hypothetical protein
MILPTKHIRLSESILGLSGVLLSFIVKNPVSLDALWMEYSKINNSKDLFPAYHTFDDIVLAVNLLFMMGIININNRKEIYKI